MSQCRVIIRSKHRVVWITHREQFVIRRRAGLLLFLDVERQCISHEVEWRENRLGNRLGDPLGNWTFWWNYFKPFHHDIVTMFTGATHLLAERQPLKAQSRKASKWRWFCWSQQCGDSLLMSRVLLLSTLKSNVMSQTFQFEILNLIFPHLPVGSPTKAGL